MAVRDVSFYKYLEAAFRHKLFKDRSATSFNYLGFNLPYDRIFYYARRVLPNFYRTSFPDTPEGNLELAKTVLKKLDLHQDLELTKYFDPVTAPEENVTVIAQASQESAAQPTPTGPSMPAGLPSMPTITTPRISIPRYVSNAPPAPEPPKPEIHIANKGGVVTGAPPPKSELVVATSSGAVKEAPPKQIFIANSRGVVTGMQNIKSPGWLKTLGSNAQIFARKNLGRVTGGLGEMVKGVGRGITGPGVTGAYNLLGKAGNGAISFGANLSNQTSRLSSVASPSKKVLIGALLGFLLLTIGISLISPTQPAVAMPIPPGGLLDYTLPLRNSSVVPLDIRAIIQSQWPNAQIDNWQIIVDQAIANGWNPAFVLALWIEESGAQGAASYTDALGCAPLQPTTDINVSLSCLFNNFSSFTDDQFAQFMARYSGGPADNPFANNPNFPVNLKYWYSQLVPSGPGAITMVAVTVSSCPASGRISIPYGFNIASYVEVANEGCGSLPLCHNGIDIAASYGSPVRSTIDGTITAVGYDGLKGNYMEITDSSGLKITLEHLATTTKWIQSTATKGETVATVGSSGAATGPVLHYKISRGGTLLNPFRTLGSSATLDPKVLAASDNIAQNNYSGVPASENWGLCN